MIHIKLNSKKVNILVKNPGILEVPEGKKVTSLNKFHIEELVKKKGRAKISRSVTNLKVWNKNKRTESANEIRAWANKALKWIDNFSEKTNASSIVSNSINTCIGVKSGVNSGDFFKNYSQVAGKIKKIKKMKGDKLKNAEKALKKAIDAMANLKKVIG